MSRLKERVVAALPTAVVAVFTGVAAVLGSYAAAGFTPSFVVAPIAGFLSRNLPDVVIRYAVTILGSLGQKLNLLTAIGLVVVVVSVMAGGLIALGRRLNNRAVAPVLSGVGVWVLTTLITQNPMLSLGAALPAAALVGMAEILQTVELGGEVTDSRRQVIGTGIGLFGLGVASTALGRQRTPGKEGSISSGSSSSSDQRQQLLSSARAKSFELSGMDPLVSEGFFQVDINAVDPTVNESNWSLSVTGAVESEVTVNYDELQEMESTDRFETLRCVGENLNGHKMDTALWTGVPIMDLVEKAGPQSGCECVMLRAEDGYYEEFPMAALEDGLIAYGMNGEFLPRAHGFPARALIPGHWGEINVKWISEIEILERETDGYWEERGWHGTGPVNTVAKIHHTNTDSQDGQNVVGGHAYAGTRGIQNVEVSTDGGSTWNEAELTEPIEGIDVWRQWRYTYDPPGGEHEVVARAIDGTGELQPQAESDAFPSGPSGWVSTTLQ